VRRPRCPSVSIQDQRSFGLPHPSTPPLRCRCGEDTRSEVQHCSIQFAAISRSAVGRLCHRPTGVPGLNPSPRGPIHAPGPAFGVQDRAFLPQPRRTSVGSGRSASLSASRPNWRPYGGPVFNSARSPTFTLLVPVFGVPDPAFAPGTGTAAIGCIWSASYRQVVPTVVVVIGVSG